MSLGEKIRDVREKLGIDRIEFADMLGVAQTTISKYETNKINPSKKVVARIKEVTGVDVTKEDYEEHITITKKEYIRLKNEVLIKDGFINKLNKDNKAYKDQLESIKNYLIGDRG